jgi:hypothetical protein
MLPCTQRRSLTGRVLHGYVLGQYSFAWSQCGSEVMCRGTLSFTNEI